jgi:hypothetical protein
VLGKKCLLPLQDTLGAPSQPTTKGSADSNQKSSFTGLEMQEHGAKSSDFGLEAIEKSTSHRKKGR